MSRISDYTTVALPGAGQNIKMVTVVDLMSPAGALLATTSRTLAVNGVAMWKVDGAALQLDPDRTLSRTVSLAVSSSDIDLVPREPGSLLHPETCNVVRISAGLSGGPTWTLATLLIDGVEAETEFGLLDRCVLQLVDPGRPLRSNLVDPFPWSAGEAIEVVAERLLAVVTDTTDIDLAETGYTMPAAGSFPAGGTVAELVQGLLGSAGHELTADENGRLYSRPVPPTSADGTERWRYGGPGRLPVQRARRSWSVRTPQGVLVTGGGLMAPGSSWTVPVWDTDESSQGYFSGPGEVTIEEVTWNHLGSTTQSVVAGYARLRRIGSGPAMVTLWVAPNPAMRPGDLLDLQAPGLNASGLYRVKAIGALPTGPHQLQEVTVRAVWDPAKGMGNPADPSQVCTSAASDSFDRADQNLEDLEESPGSPYWTEHAWSWAVANQVAIQRHNGTASLARWNTAMCGTDYVVASTIGEVPAGKWIGPAARSSGQFDCYAAVVDSSGRIRLELWQAGQKIEELGAYATNSDPSGGALSLSVDGPELVAIWEGVEVLGVSDTRRTGPFTGMHALGGVQGSTAPSISSWSATVV